MNQEFVWSDDRLRAPDKVAGYEFVHMQKFSVGFEFPVCFTRDLFQPDNPTFAKTLASREPDRRHRFVVFVDNGLAERWSDLGDRIANYAETFADRLELVSAVEWIPNGEQVKNTPELVEQLHRRLFELGIDRHSFVVAIGGGAVLDLVGYVAATAHRGLRHIRVPTTVLAQNDSGVGVKNGVNAFGVKNFLGTFAPPFAVLNDFSFIATLSDRDRIAGVAEAVKVALIRDADFFEWLEASADRGTAFEPESLVYTIRRCAELHMRHIATGGDPFENGSARPLDYGHWSAHKLETLTRNQLRHGEAVAIGMALDAKYATIRGMLSAVDLERICRTLERLGLALWHPSLDAQDAEGRNLVLDGLREFREHLGGDLTVTLLRGIGRGVEVHEIDEAQMRAAINWLRARGERQ